MSKNSKKLKKNVILLRKIKPKQISWNNS